MRIQSLPAASLMAPRWTPFASLGQIVPPAPPPVQVPAPVQVPVYSVPPPKGPFIDGAFLAFLLDSAVAVAGVISGTVYWRTASEKTSASEKASSKRMAYVFYGLGGLFAVKGILDGGRIMR